MGLQPPFLARGAVSCAAVWDSLRAPRREATTGACDTARRKCQLIRKLQTLLPGSRARNYSLQLHRGVSGHSKTGANFSTLQGNMDATTWTASCWCPPQQAKCEQGDGSSLSGGYCSTVLRSTSALGVAERMAEMRLV